MAGRGMGCAVKGGGAVASGPKNRVVSETSKKSGPIMMKSGGMVRGYSEGGDVDDEMEPDVQRRSYASGVRVNYDDSDTKSTAKAGSKAPSARDTDKNIALMSDTSKNSPMGDMEDTSAVTGRARRTGSPGRPATEREKKLMRAVELGSILIPGGVVGRGAMAAGRMADKMRKLGQSARPGREAEKMSAAAESRASRIRDRTEMERMREGKSFGDRDIGYKRGGYVKKVKRYRKGGMCT